MRQEGLLVVPHRKYRHTTNSNHDYPIYANLIKHRTLLGINQVWVSDITYIEYGNRFAYLAVILDAYSRKVIGWHIRQHIDTTLTLEALAMALASRELPPGLIHHSDRGVQYAAHAYVDTLNAYGIAISMSAPGNPYENAKAESFMKTLKNEEVYFHRYERFEEVEESIRRFIYDYNLVRIHSSIDYLSPMEYEQQLTGSHHHQQAAKFNGISVSL
jgi:transposase InsO family protein